MFGAHVSVAGGLHKAFVWTEKYRCECLQIFTKSQLKWAAKPLREEEIRDWQTARRASGDLPCFVHGSYLLNLASPDEALRRKSIEALVDEMERADALDIGYVNVHPGSHKGAGEEAGLKACVQSLNDVLKRTSSRKTMLLLETTAGQGNDLGARFEQLAYLLEHAQHAERLGVCADTCHIFSAGYDFRTAAGYEKVWKDFDNIIGLKRLKLFHLNDSKFEAESHRDRHAEIGKGLIGDAAFRRLVRDPRFTKLPGITELPEEITTASLDTLRKLRGKIET